MNRVEDDSGLVAVVENNGFVRITRRTGEVASHFRVIDMSVEQATLLIPLLEEILSEDS